jgi:tetratricopeptide (TPR) repeat protein
MRPKMPRIHPKGGPIEALVAQLPEAQRRTLRHALGCATCRAALLAALDPAGPGEPGLGLGRLLTWRPTERSYGKTIDAVLRRLEPRLCVAQLEQAEAPALADELLAAPAAERAALLDAGDRFRSLGLAQLLGERSRATGFADGRRAVELADLALAVIDRLDDAGYGARLLADARGHACTLLASARRIVSDLRGADEAFTAAEAHLARGTGDPLARAFLLHRKASLRRAQHRYAEAAALLDATISVYLRAGDLQQAAEAILNLSILHLRTGDHERALAELRRAAELNDPAANPQLDLWIRHNTIAVLSKSGQYLEAQALLARSGELYRRHGDAVLELRRRWIAGEVARGTGDLDAAAQLFREVREGFIERGIGYDVALVSLDLAGLCARRGESAEVRRLAEECVPLFLARDVYPEALALIVLFREAAAAERATAELIDRLALQLRLRPLDARLPGGA